jgi:hypothetical protein
MNEVAGQINRAGEIAISPAAQAPTQPMRFRSVSASQIVATPKTTVTRRILKVVNP